MHTLILSHAEVVRLLPMATCIDLMADALSAVSKGAALQPLRQVRRLPNSPNAFALMPALLGDALAPSSSRYSRATARRRTNRKSAWVLYFETKNGQLRAIIDASSITRSEQPRFRVCNATLGPTKRRGPRASWRRRSSVDTLGGDGLRTAVAGACEYGAARRSVARRSLGWRRSDSASTSSCVQALKML